MNRSSALGVAIAVAVLYLGVLHGAKNPMMFLDEHALLLVMGGTISATLISFPFKQIVALFDFLAFGVFFKKEVDLAGIVGEMRMANEAVRRGDFMSLQRTEFSHPFLREGISLLLEPELSVHDVEMILGHRKERFKWKYQQDAKTLNAIAKYPPAFGLLGASTGMIAMMTNLGGAGGTKAIGAAMAVALVATFWGIAAANFVLLPLADHANRNFLKDQHLRQLILQGILRIKSGASDAVLGETLRSMLDLETRQSIRVKGTPAVRTGLRVVTAPGVPTQSSPSQFGPGESMSQADTEVKPNPLRKHGG